MTNCFLILSSKTFIFNGIQMSDEQIKNRKSKKSNKKFGGLKKTLYLCNAITKKGV